MNSPAYKAAPDKSGFIDNAQGRFIDRCSVAGRLYRPEV
jgi:hypothetical protein